MKRPAVFDCFTFFNELDLLEVRLEELSPVVDWFVLVEAARTFTNKSKPFYFQENAARFEKFLHKIIPISLTNMPPTGSTWSLESFQRDAVASGLGRCRPDDYVIISDLDEIPRAEAVASFVAAGGDVTTFSMPLFYYRFNCKNTTGEAAQPLSLMVRRRFLSTPQAARACRFALPTIHDGGWHFSYLGDEGHIRTKIEAFSHQELNKPEFTEEEKLRSRVTAGEDLFSRPGYSWSFVPLDDSFPRFVRENRERFSHLIQAV